MKLRDLVAIVTLLTVGATVQATELVPLFTDMNNAGVVIDDLNMFADPPAFFLDDTAQTDGGNDIAVYTIDGTPTFNGSGFSLSVSNGENGFTQTVESDGSINMDADNLAPVNPVIASMNNSGRLENGNAIRFSVWIRQDPNDPITAVPQIEPVLKIELWKEALGSAADFNPGPFPGFGDRIWDTDQNAGDPSWGGTQSEADWLDLNADGMTSFGKPVSQTAVTSQWRLFETDLVIDDAPSGLDWGIGTNLMDVSWVEEIRGVFYMGDFLQTPLPQAGSFWVDNLLMEFFATEADMLNTPNPNPMPIDVVAPPCDLDGDMDCDIDDLDMLYAEIEAGNAINAEIDAWLNDAGTENGLTYLPGDTNLDGSVGGPDFTTLASNFGNTGLANAGWGQGNFNGNEGGQFEVGGPDFTDLASNFGFTSVSSVPEPNAAILLLMAAVSLGLIRRRK